jgi:hypothetical protein
MLWIQVPEAIRRLVELGLKAKAGNRTGSLLLFGLHA